MELVERVYYLPLIRPKPVTNDDAFCPQTSSSRPTFWTTASCAADKHRTMDVELQDAGCR